MDHTITNKQSCLNYMNYMESVKDDLESMYPYSKITNVRTIDELYDRHLINEEFYKGQRGRIYKEDKEEETQDMICSMSVAALILTGFMIYLYPSNDFYILKPFYLIYLFMIYSLSILFYFRKHHFKED